MHALWRHKSASWLGDETSKTQKYTTLIVNKEMWVENLNLSTNRYFFSFWNSLTATWRQFWMTPKWSHRTQRRNPSMLTTSSSPFKCTPKKIWRHRQGVTFYLKRRELEIRCRFRCRSLPVVSDYLLIVIASLIPIIDWKKVSRRKRWQELQLDLPSRIRLVSEMTQTTQ